MANERIRLTEEAVTRQDYAAAKEGLLEAVQDVIELAARMTTPADPLHYGHIKEVNFFASMLREVVNKYIVY